MTETYLDLAAPMLDEVDSEFHPEQECANQYYHDCWRGDHPIPPASIVHLQDDRACRKYRQ